MNVVVLMSVIAWSSLLVRPPPLRDDVVTLVSIVE
jgi:hypothetical protein